MYLATPCISLLLIFWTAASARVVDAVPGLSLGTGDGLRNISTTLFNELEELARLVDIAYCVGVSGVWKPFTCLGRCGDFEGFELVDTWNTGPLLSDSCGYIALDHAKGRVIAAFRGTYSVSNTIVDLSTVPQEYVPYPGDPDDPENDSTSPPGWFERFKRGWGWFGGQQQRLSEIQDTHESGDMDDGEDRPKGPKCTNCTVHTGFLASWLHTRPHLLPHFVRLRTTHPGYTIHLVGHSLGGAVAALAGLELDVKGFSPVVTTFGEPKIGNVGLARYLDDVFGLGGKGNGQDSEMRRYRRVTHVDDPVPLLPLAEWGYRMHAGEIYISKAALSPSVSDLEHCYGDEDPKCIAGADEAGRRMRDQGVINQFAAMRRRDEDGTTVLEGEVGETDEMEGVETTNWGIQKRFRMWQLFFAHRDYFWRLGVCVPGGDPAGWWKGRAGYDGEEL